MTKTPLKWMGSKKKLVGFITSQIPKYNTYIEPFLGSGIVFFSQEPRNAICSDIQQEPIIILNSIKYDYKEFYATFELYANNLYGGGEKYYYQLRDDYNNREDFNNVEKAAIFMVLSHTSFNGLIRFNSKGKCNVPYGKRYSKENDNNKLTDFIKLDDIKKYSEILNSGNKKFIKQSFEKTISKAKEGDFIYCDPPYLITTQQYNKWNNELELQLFNSLNQASERGAKFILSNVYEYKGKINQELMNLYNKYEYKLQNHSYIVGPKNSRRQQVKEIIIYN